MDQSDPGTFNLVNIIQKLNELVVENIEFKERITIQREKIQDLWEEQDMIPKTSPISRNFFIRSFTNWDHNFFVKILITVSIIFVGLFVVLPNNLSITQLSSSLNRSKSVINIQITAQSVQSAQVTSSISPILCK